DIETTLRETLHDRAEQVTVNGDPWPQFAKHDRRHRRGRRARIATVAVAAGTVIALAGSGVVSVPTWIPALTIQQASSPLLDQPPSGSLAADRGWLAAFRAQVPRLLADAWEGDQDGHWKVDDVDEIQVIFAGDVGFQRLVAALVPVRTGVLRGESTVWFRGSVGADPDEMEHDSNGEPLTKPYVGRVDGQANRGDVLVLAQEGSHVEVSGSVEFRSDGTVGRTWTTIPRRDTGEYVTRIRGTGMEGLSLRVTAPGRDAETGRFDFGTWSNIDLPQRLEAAIDDATSELDGAHRELARTLDYFVDLGNFGLEPTNIKITALWAGDIDGETAILLAVQPTDGGVLLFARRGGPTSDGGYGAEDLLHLLAPADGAYTRPYAWRILAREDTEPVSVFVVAPKGAESAEIRLDDGTSVPVELDSTGAGMVRADADKMTVVAFDATGRVLGETPVPPIDDDGSSVPGETRATSVVMNEE
ncbi:MAG TPA: hypothetical protein VIQ02_04900, partial [Jiangellaceae bacterium]